MDTCKPGFVIINWELIGLLTQVYVFLMMILISVLVQWQKRLLFAGFTAVKKTIIQKLVYTTHV